MDSLDAADGCEVVEMLRKSLVPQIVKHGTETMSSEATPRSLPKQSENSSLKIPHAHVYQHIS